MRATLLAMILLPLAMPAWAQGTDTARYQLISVSGGFVRLDMVSGIMTFCRDEVDSFRCSPIKAGEEPVEVRPELKPGQDTKRLTDKPREGADEMDFDRALGMMEKAMRSFMAITQEKSRECAL